MEKKEFFRMPFLKFAANERTEWIAPCALECNRVLLSDSMLSGLTERDFAENTAVLIASGMSIADCCNVLIKGFTSSR